MSAPVRWFRVQAPFGFLVALWSLTLAAPPASWALSSRAPAGEARPAAAAPDPRARFPKRSVVHPPFVTADCTTCHTERDGDPYALTEELPGLCYACHEAVDQGAHVHPPVLTGGCTVCHDPHQSDTAATLKAPSQNELCVMCHEEKAAMVGAGEAGRGSPHGRCDECHDPHSAEYELQLSAPPARELCVSCHAEAQARMAAVKVRHAAVDTGRACLGCHDPHAVGVVGLIRAENTLKLCLGCHDRALGGPKNPLTNMAEHLEKNPDWHGPIREGDCSSCHDPHGSDHAHLLRRPFPERFYSAFDEKQYLCFSCHPSDRFLEEHTVEATRFRNGTSNMHFLHVNRERGRTCRACHDLHASARYPHHLRTHTVYGKIPFPMTFKETPTGGACLSACHLERGYDRVRPVVNER